MAFPNPSWLRAGKLTCKVGHREVEKLGRVRPSEREASQCNVDLTTAPSRYHKVEQASLIPYSTLLPKPRRVCLMSATGNGAPALGATEDVSRHNYAEPTVMDGLSSSKVTGIDLLRFELASKTWAEISQLNTMIRLGYFL